MTELICLGDSLTYGPGVPGSRKWTALAARDGLSITNLGVSGDTTAGMLARLQNLQCKGASVLVLGGTNDIFYAGTDATARCSLGAIVQQLQALSVPVLVGIPLPVCPQDAPQKWAKLANFRESALLLEDYCRWLRTFCEAFDIPVVDFRADFLSADGSVRRELFLDGLHPNAQGHALMAKRLQEALA